MPPVLAERHRVREAQVLLHAVAPAGVLLAADGLREPGVEHVLVECLDGYLGPHEHVGALRILKHDGLVGVGLVARHADETLQRQ